MIKRSRTQWVRYWLPQGVRDYLNRLLGFAIIYRGRFKSWAEAERTVAGYDDNALFERIYAAAIKVKTGEAIWEKDGVTFDHIPADFRLWACLSKVALDKQGCLAVMDFGGAFGSSYHQCRSFLADGIELRWSVVEQDHIAAVGSREFADRSLSFYSTVDDCLRNEKPNVVLLSSVLQYLEFPYALLSQIVESPIEYLIIDRNPCSISGEEIITTQILPSKTLYPGGYASWLFDRTALLGWLDQYYELLLTFDGSDPPILGAGFGASFHGFFFRKRKKNE